MGYNTQDDTFDDDTLGQMAGLGGLDDDAAKAKLQLQIAALLRTKGRDKGQMAGQMYIPPNPVDSFLDSYDRIQGMSQMNDANKTISDIGDKRKSAIADFMKQWQESKLDQRDPLRVQAKSNIKGMADKLKDEMEWPTL